MQNLKILDRYAFAHCKFEIRRSTATSYKEISPEIVLTLKNTLFLLKVLKTYVFTQIAECSIVTHLHHQILRSRA